MKSLFSHWTILIIFITQDPRKTSFRRYLTRNDPFRLCVYIHTSVIVRYI